MSRSTSSAKRPRATHFSSENQYGFAVAKKRRHRRRSKRSSRLRLRCSRASPWVTPATHALQEVRSHPWQLHASAVVRPRLPEGLLELSLFPWRELPRRDEQ